MFYILDKIKIFLYIKFANGNICKETLSRVVV